MSKGNTTPDRVRVWVLWELDYEDRYFQGAYADLVAAKAAAGELVTDRRRNRINNLIIEGYAPGAEPTYVRFASYPVLGVEEWDDTPGHEKRVEAAREKWIAAGRPR